MEKIFQLQSTSKKQLNESSDVKLEYEATPKKGNILKKVEFNDDESTLQKVFQKNQNEGIKRTILIKKETRKSKTPWTKEQDELLKELVSKKGAKQWAEISSYFILRCGKQCRQRWHNHLRNGIRKGHWTTEEEWILFLGVQAYGKKWSIISKLLEGRTQNTLKNHWNCKMKPRKERYENKMRLITLQYPHFSLSPIENKLFQLIRIRQSSNQNPKHEDKVDQIVNLLKKSLGQFYKLKRQIYAEYNMNSYDDIIEDKHYDMQSFGSFGKKKQLQKRISKKKNPIHFQNENESHHIQQESDCFDEQFGLEVSLFQASDSNQSYISYDQAEEIISKMKNYKNTHEQKEDSESLNVVSEAEKEKSQEEQRFEIANFYSPIKLEEYQKIDLGQSNKKKRLFE